MALRLSEGLGRSGLMKLLNYAFPPAFSDLKLDEGSGGCCSNDLTPERLRSVVGWHLADFPWTWMTLEDVQRQGSTCPGATVPLEYEELLHPQAFFLGNDGRRDESEADVLRALKCYMSVKPLTVLVALKVVSIL